VALTLRESVDWNDSAIIWGHDHPDSLWRTHSDQVNLAFLTARLPQQPVSRLLKTDLFDEAVGIGLLAVLGTRAHGVFGIDISFGTLENACKSAGKTICADVRHLPFTTGSFDIVVSNSTLDHFQSWDDVVASLQELRRVLRPGGELLLTLDNMANPIIALRNLLPFKWLHHAGIVPYYVGVSCGPVKLRRLLKSVELELIEMTSILHCPRILVVHLARALRARAGTDAQRKFLHWLMEFERLSQWPTRYLTGNFLAVRCIKRNERPA
jgi:ubiquinone/menaquinone biosynthesis C-methylase UbiE